MRPFGKLRVRWEEHIEIKFRKIRCKDEYQTKLAQNWAHWLFWGAGFCMIVVSKFYFSPPNTNKKLKEI